MNSRLTIKMAKIKWILVSIALLGISLSDGQLDGHQNSYWSIIKRDRRDAQACGGVLQGSEGTFSLPTQECGNGTYRCYSKDMECQWSIEAPAGQILMLRSDDFDLELSDDCVWDYVQIIEGDGRKTKHCGWYPLLYISTTNKLTINFKSDAASYEGSGFTFDYMTYVPDLDTRCNTSVIAGRDGKIKNDASSKDSCYYSIEAPEGKVVQLNVLEKDFGTHSCHEEQLVIRSGTTMQGKKEGVVCNKNNVGALPGPFRAMFIEYTNSLEATGFRFALDYEFVDPPPPKTYDASPFGGDPDCSHFYKGILKTGVELYEAPKYEKNRNCIVVIRNTLLPNSVVQVTFEKFHLEDSDNCTYDSLQIKLGERSTSKALGGPYCGKVLNGRTFVSYGNSLRLEYKTDESLSWFGVRAKISFVERGRCDECDNGVCILQDNEKICIQGRICDDDLCQNGGTCVKTRTHSTKCYCPAGFSGDDCSEGSGIHLKDPWKSKRVALGDSIFPRCYTGTDEAETVIWYVNGERMGSYDEIEKRGTLDDGFLQIMDFDHDDEGLYTCYVENSHGSLEHTFELTSTKDCEVDFSTRPLPQTIHLGNDVLFPCNPMHATSFHWEWAESSGQPFQRVKGDRFEQQPSSGYLLIKDTVPEDTGIYRCVAQDKSGCSSSREAKLTILETKKYNNYCGISRHDEDKLTSKIYKGDEAKPGRYPWHVTLKTAEGPVFCGGTVISTQYVITAAHCIVQEDKQGKPKLKESVQLLFGDTSCKQSDIKRTPESYIIHENYNAKTYDNDIAIIKLDHPVEFDDRVRPICLDSDANIKAMFFRKSNIFGKVTGCGLVLPTTKAKDLQVVDLPIVSKDRCEVMVKDWNSRKPNKAYLTENKICAGYKKARKSDVCKGDSGGGLVMDHAYKHYLTGIVSSGPSCGSKTEMVGFYTDVGKYFYWIDMKTDFTKERCDSCEWAM